MRTLKQSEDQCDQPLIFVWRSQGGKPHLPVEPGLVRRTPTGHAFHVAGFPLEFVREPINPVDAPFEDDFAAVLRHHAEKAVAIHNAKCFESFVKVRQYGRWWNQRFECTED